MLQRSLAQRHYLLQAEPELPGLSGCISPCRDGWRRPVTLCLEGWWSEPLEAGNSLGEAGYVELASALNSASTWRPGGSTRSPGGLRSRDPGQAGNRAAQTGHGEQQWDHASEQLSLPSPADMGNTTLLVLVFGFTFLSISLLINNCLGGVGSGVHTPTVQPTLTGRDHLIY